MDGRRLAARGAGSVSGFKKALIRTSVLGLAGILMVGGVRAGWAQSAAGSSDAQIQADVSKALDNKKFKNVKSTVQNGEVTLSGTVELYSAKEEADKKAHHRKGVKAVQNLIEVDGLAVDDVQLRNK